MSKPFLLGKFKPKLVYYGLPLEDAVKVMDYYVSNYDSDKFDEAHVFEQFDVYMIADAEGDEYREGFRGTYTVQFRGHCYRAISDTKETPWEYVFSQLKNLHKLIESELGIK